MAHGEVAQPGERAARGHRLRKRGRLLHEIAVHDRVEEARAFELDDGHGGAGDDHVERRLETHRARKALRPARPREEAELHLGQRHLGAAGGHAIVAGEG
jgi:hypothetical protein